MRDVVELIHISTPKGRVPGDWRCEYPISPSVPLILVGESTRLSPLKERQQ